MDSSVRLVEMDSSNGLMQLTELRCLQRCCSADFLVDDWYLQRSAKLLKAEKDRLDARKLIVLPYEHEKQKAPGEAFRVRISLIELIWSS